jgi:hypothetical protein
MAHSSGSTVSRFVGTAIVIWVVRTTAWAQAGTVTVVPGAPTSADFVVVRVHGGDSENCDQPVSGSARAAVIGTQIRITFQSCGVHQGAPVPPCPWNLDVPIGRMPPGDYSIAVTRLLTCVPTSQAFASGAFSVVQGAAPIPVPTLNEGASAVFLLLLGLSGLFLLRHR